MCSGDQHILSGLFVHDNDVTQTQGNAQIAGISQDTGDSGVFSSRSNRFTGNVYHGVSGRPFAWNNQLMTEQEWTAAGQQ